MDNWRAEVYNTVITAESFKELANKMNITESRLIAYRKGRDPNIKIFKLAQTVNQLHTVVINHHDSPILVSFD